MLVIGLISGTSVDGIDAALVEIVGTEADLEVKLLAGATYPYPVELRSKILQVCGGAPLSMAEVAELDDAIATVFAQTALNIQADYPKAQLIGSHGQNIYHRPRSQSAEKTIKLGYSWQLGRGAAIAALTGITTISNFRVADIAVGGEGAPLVSRIDVCLLSHPQYHRCIQNVGGIANVTYLPPGERGNRNPQILGWDTGPGNTLLDLAVLELSGGTKTYDQNGAWAATGTPCMNLVKQWLKHDFFQQSPPKSTGRELFGQAYWQQCLADAQAYNLHSADLLATLTEFTVATIEYSYRHFLPHPPEQVLLCGGGSRNLYLKQRLSQILAPIQVLTTDEAGLSADFKEAIAFAVLAYWRFLGIPGNLPEVTGAKHSVLLGEIYPVA